MLLGSGQGREPAYQVDNLPMTVLIDRGGIIRHVLRDYSPRDEALYLQRAARLC